MHIPFSPFICSFQICSRVKEQTQFIEDTVTHLLDSIEQKITDSGQKECTLDILSEFAVPREIFSPAISGHMNEH